MIVDPVTARYGEALFGLAHKHGRLAALARDVERLASELAGPLGAAVFDGRETLARRHARLEPLLAGMDPLLRKFVGLLFDKRRVDVLRQLGRAFQLRLQQEQGVLEGVVESPRPLTEGDLAELAVGLAPRFKKKLLLENRVHPELLAGVRVLADSRMLDASAQGRLESLRKKMLEVALPASPH